MREETRAPDIDEVRADFEIRRLKTEERIRQFTLDKLHEEIKELRRPWYARASAVPAYATLLVALVGGFLAFGTDLLKSNIVALKRSNQEQAIAQQTLKSSIADLNRQKQAVQLELQEEKSQLARVGFTKELEALKRSRPESMQLRDWDPIILETEALKQNAPAELNRALEQLRREQSGSSGVSHILFSYVLLRITHEPVWAGDLRQSLASDETGMGYETLRYPIIRQILQTDTFDVQTRAAYLKRVYETGYAIPGYLPNDSSFIELCRIAMWDRQASAQFPKLYSACLTHFWVKWKLAADKSTEPGLDLRKYDGSQKRLEDRIFFELSPQIALLAVLSSITPSAHIQYKRDFATARVLFQPNDVAKLDEFPEDFPCKAGRLYKTVGENVGCQIDFTHPWLIKNARLIDIILHGFPDSGEKNPQLWRDIIQGEYLTLSKASTFTGDPK